MPAEISLPVYMRVGDSPEQELGTLTMPISGGQVELSVLRVELATFYRALADAVEHPPQDDKEATDGTA
ncbi:hypothetical protein ACGF1Z_31180 [Streptomyces sp. NPDC048018]|uniref:hypothetical protein n=1 Tax=Streptomyces sp. NPDC048018 TaxID=3365499 RepID=UPI003720CB69